MEIVYKKGQFSKEKRTPSKYAANMLLLLMWVMTPIIKAASSINKLMQTLKFYLRLAKWVLGAKDSYVEKLINTSTILNKKK